MVTWGFPVVAASASPTSPAFKAGGYPSPGCDVMEPPPPPPAFLLSDSRLGTLLLVDAGHARGGAPRCGISRLVLAVAIQGGQPGWGFGGSTDSSLLRTDQLPKRPTQNPLPDRSGAGHVYGRCGGTRLATLADDSFRYSVARHRLLAVGIGRGGKASHA